MALLDVNVLVALAWDSHIHHAAARAWFSARAPAGWSTCSVTETGFVRVSSNPKVLPSPISVAEATRVLAAICGAPGHSFVVDEVSPRDADMPSLSGHRQVTDAHLLVLARRHQLPLVTFDAAVASLAMSGDKVEVLTAL